MHSSPSSEGSWKGSSFSVDRLVGTKLAPFCIPTCSLRFGPFLLIWTITQFFSAVKSLNFELCDFGKCWE